MAVPQTVALDAEGGSVEVLHEELPRAQPLWHEGWRVGGGMRLGRGRRPLGNGVEAHVALERARHPIAYAAFACQRHPLGAAREGPVQRGLEHQVVRTYGVEQALLFGRLVHTYHFLVEGDGQGRRAAQRCHLIPLALLDGLLNAVQTEAGQCFEAGGGFGG